MDGSLPLSGEPREYALMRVSCMAYDSYRDAVDHVQSLIVGAARGYTVSINAEKIVRCQHDETFSTLVKNALVRVPDGAGAVLALRLLRKVRSAKVDFPAAALQAAAELGQRCRLGIIGASEESHQKAIAEIQRRYPAIQIVMHRSGYVSADDLLAALHDSQPQLCLLAMGAPKQEQFANLAVAAGIPCLFVCCGGALDILSGHVMRAPTWMVDHYLEWFYRLLQQPSRWRRQTVLLIFLGLLLKMWIIDSRPKRENSFRV